MHKLSDDSGPAVDARPRVAGWRTALSGRVAERALGGVALAAAAFGVAVLLPPDGLRQPLAGVAVLMLAGLCAAGAVGARALARLLHEVEQREQRSERFLRLAADWHWELDRDFRFTRVVDPRGLTPARLLEERIGKRPWEIDDIGIDPEAMDAHRADLEAHRPFAGLLARQRDAEGRPRLHSVSGEPHCTAEGVFDGYTGLARDVTDEARTQRAFAASETRYRELFERSPSPIFLHRHGVVFEANPAAARLFGFNDAAAMAGIEVVSLHPPAERSRVAAMVNALDRLPIGQGMPVSDFQARMRDGRAVSVQATGVRVDAVGGPAAMTLLFDITVRQAAQAALRRSEAMLSHLFATSPDCITLSELQSGRHTMVNAAFARLTGYAVDEIVGRTATELGIWRDLRDRDRLRESMMSAGRVSEMRAAIRHRSGSVASVLVSAARFAMDGRDYMVVNARDVTAAERTRLEHAAIFERATIGIALTRDRRFVHVNPRFEATFGWPVGTLVGQPGAAVWNDEDDYTAIGRIAGPLLSAGLPFEVEREMKKHDGSSLWVRLLGQPIDPAQPSHGGTIWIADDVTERRRLDAALAAARDAAEAASRAKSAFLANTSHEIRTPLNGLLGLARLALADGVDAARLRGYLEQIFQSALGLEAILSDILDFSKMEAGKFTLDNQAFDLREMLAALHASYRPLAEARSLAFELQIDPGLPARWIGDPLRVRQILVNFISNAIKFTEAGSVRLVAGPAESGEVRLAVVDTGKGVEPELQAQLFQPFSQGDAGATRRFGGTGLGLSICRQLAELMGGEVGLDSRPGQGSTFWAELPLAPAAPVAEPAGSEASEGEQLSRARVLLVEDNPVNMLIARATLQQWGVEVEEARDGRMAIAAVEAAARGGRPFDLVLMDLQMPVMSGHEAAIELRKDWSAGKLPIIALTAAALVSEREEALAAGMNDFLTKPLDVPKLRRTLVRHVHPGPHRRGAAR